MSTGKTGTPSRSSNKWTDRASAQSRRVLEVLDHHERPNVDINAVVQDFGIRNLGVSDDVRYCSCLCHRLLLNKQGMVGQWQADEDLGGNAFDADVIQDVESADGQKRNKVCRVLE